MIIRFYRTRNAILFGAAENAAQAAGRVVQQAVEDAGKNASYAAGNSTVNAILAGEQLNKACRTGAAMECGKALGGNAFRAGEDIAANDKLCTGLCLLSCVCEVVGFSCAFIAFPGAAKVYTASKSVSWGCIEFRDRCKKSKVQLPGC